MPGIFIIFTLGEPVREVLLVTSFSDEEAGPQRLSLFFRV